MHGQESMVASKVARFGTACMLSSVRDEEYGRRILTDVIIMRLFSHPFSLNILDRDSRFEGRNTCRDRRREPASAGLRHRHVDQ